MRALFFVAFQMCDGCRAARVAFIGTASWLKFGFLLSKRSQGEMGCTAEFVSTAAGTCARCSRQHRRAARRGHWRDQCRARVASEHCRPLELETCTCTEEGLLDTHQGQDVRSKRLSIMVEEEVLRSDV